jgi:hypothetical protein
MLLFRTENNTPEGYVSYFWFWHILKVSQQVTALFEQRRMIEGD